MKDTLRQAQLGCLTEQKACDFLKTKGLKLISKNYHCAHGEIDLIMQEKNELVFVEVRFRSHEAYGNAIDSIDYHKQKKILKSATHYLQKNNLLDKINCRFDVIGFSKNNDIDWIKDAFSHD